MNLCKGAMKVLSLLLLLTVLIEGMGISKQTGAFSATVRKKRELWKKTAVNWPELIVPYVMNTSLNKYKEAVQYATLQYNDQTCVKFVDVANQTNENLGLKHSASIMFVDYSGHCYATEGFNDVSKAKTSCCSKITCLHEAGHILGAIHEHQRFDRDAYINVNFQNIIPNYKFWMISRYFNTERTEFDFASVMLYGPKDFSVNKKDTYTVLDPEHKYLIINNKFSLSYYDIKSVNERYRCKEKVCPDFSHTCANDGYVAKVRGVCRCMCPEGLDSSTMCSKNIKQNTVKNQWPAGNYDLARPISGCPSGEWTESERKHWQIGHNKWTEHLHLSNNYSKLGIVQKFCGHNSSVGSTWEPGSYCILKRGKMCPKGFNQGSVFINDYPSKSHQNANKGELPAGTYDADTEIIFCCRADASWITPLTKLPTDKPFILFMSKLHEACQKVEGMAAYSEDFTFYDWGDTKKNKTSGDYPNVVAWKYGVVFRYCYYVPLKRDCGEVIHLSDNRTSVTFTSPNYPDHYDNNFECHWFIKGTPGSIIRLQFTDFEIEEEEGKCRDSVKIRANMIGQPGKEYCGSFLHKRFISSHNYIAVSFSSNYEINKKGFKAVATLVRDADLCYNAADKGASYRGKMNNTRFFQPCVAWSKAENCFHKSYNGWDLNKGLEGHNYCRNPGNGNQPWCYTSTETCERDYCDVCQINGCYDLANDCSSLMKTDPGLCARSEDYSKCYKSCGKCMDENISVNKVSCPKPSSPSNGELLGSINSSYSIGDIVTVQCWKNTNNPWKQNMTCLSTGKWDRAGSICGDWLHWNGSCFKFFKDDVKYTAAVTKCQEYNGIVAGPKSEAQMNVVNKLAEEIPGDFWLGMVRNEPKTKVWKIEGTIGNTTTRWKNNEPDNKYSLEDCVKVSTYTNSTWSDVYCHWYNYFRFVCKLNAQSPDCVDSLDNCHQQILQDKGVCQKQRYFAEQFCRYSCSFCKPN